MTDREERAARRRASWQGQVVEPGAAKPGLYATLPLAERLLALARLNVRAWTATGRPWPEPLPRSEWPGEVFEVRSGG